MKTEFNEGVLALNRLYLALYQAAVEKQSDNVARIFSYGNDESLGVHIEVILGVGEPHAVGAGFKLVHNQQHDALAIRIVINHRANVEKIIYGSQDPIKDYNYAGHAEYLLKLMDNECNYLKECRTYA